mgnify:CR=1 FL=1
MRWSRITPIGNKKCATAECNRSARWHGVSGDVGSDWCAECRDSIDVMSMVEAADKVLGFDWSDCDSDAFAAIQELQRAVSNYRGE